MRVAQVFNWLVIYTHEGETLCSWEHQIIAEFISRVDNAPNRVVGGLFFSIWDFLLVYTINKNSVHYLYYIKINILNL